RSRRPAGRSLGPAGRGTPDGRGGRPARCGRWRRVGPAGRRCVVLPRVGGQVVGAVVLVAATPAPAALGRLQLPRPELLVVVLLTPTTSASGTRRLVMVGERHARRPWCPGASEDAIDVKER